MSRRRLGAAALARAAFTLLVATSLPASADEPERPLRFADQARETRIDAAYTRSTRNDARDKSVGGFQVAMLFGAFPQLKWWRVGGASGAMFRAVDNKTFLLSLPYTDLTGGFRASFLELYAFVGISWITAGISHAEFAFGGVAPRAGVAFGAQTNGLALHVSAATEYHPFLVGTSDIRAYVFGLSLSFLDRPPTDPPPRR